MSPPCCAGRVRPGRDVVLGRDPSGVPHVHAGGAVDAWYGLGWAAARDRLWQLECDRRRARGRWAEVAGRPALAADKLARRLRLVDAARADVAAMDAPTAASFAAYADGVNAFIATGDLPPEYAVAELRPEPWTPADSVLAFKVRHVVMGVWQYKIARATLLSRGGRAAFDALDPVPMPGMRVTVPPHGRVRARLTERARAEIEDAARHLGFLAEVEAGSNAWALGPGRTATGAPLLANDSHRALDVPNVYWQAHLECAEFTVTGATFPGLPGFPHFGHNGRVGWAITNAGGDAQDLYIEHFRSGQVRTADGWLPVRPDEEIIEVRGEAPHTERCWRTPNGPVVHGDPTGGSALSLRWTATDGPCRQFGVLSRMLRAGGVTELLDAQRGWVDPLNNLLAADTGGHIGYLLRGELPDRGSATAARIPVPGWDPAHAWRGRVPFADMPRVEDPPEQILVTANNTVTDREHPYVAHSVTDYYRVERIHELAGDTGGHSFADMVAWQGDTVSVAARSWARLLARRGPYDGDAERARRVIAEADGDLRGDGPAGLVHACLRRALAATLLGDLLGERIARWLLSPDLPGCPVLVRRWFAELTWPREDAMPAERIGDDVLAGCLERAWRHALAAGDGDEPPAWGGVHRTAARHTLAPRFDPPSVSAGGDNETIQNAAYGWGERAPFDITNLSVYRQVLDLGDLGRSAWIIPGGASGRPGDPHYADQLADWAAHCLRAMRP